MTRIKFLWDDFREPGYVEAAFCSVRLAVIHQRKRPETGGHMRTTHAIRRWLGIAQLVVEKKAANNLFMAERGKDESGDQIGKLETKGDQMKGIICHRNDTIDESMSALSYTMKKGHPLHWQRGPLHILTTSQLLPPHCLSTLEFVGMSEKADLMSETLLQNLKRRCTRT
jgi:hypothetical protein